RAVAPGPGRGQVAQAPGIVQVSSAGADGPGAWRSGMITVGDRIRAVVAIGAMGSAIALAPAARAQAIHVVCTSEELRRNGVDCQVAIAIDYGSRTANGTPAQISDNEIRWRENAAPAMSDNTLNRITGEMWVYTYIGGALQSQMVWQCRPGQRQF